MAMADEAASKEARGRSQSYRLVELRGVGGIGLGE